MTGDRLDSSRATVHASVPDLTADAQAPGFDPLLEAERAPSRPAWERQLALLVGATDATAVVLAVVGAALLRAVLVNAAMSGAVTVAAVVALTAGWLISLNANGAYGAHVLGQGADEYKCVLAGTWRFAAVLAVGSYAFRYELSRGFLLLALPAGAAALTAGRAAGHHYLRRLQQRGVAVRRVLVVGPAHAASRLIRQFENDPSFKVVAVCTAGLVQDGVQTDTAAAVEVSEVTATLKRVQADTVAVAGTNALPDGFLSRLAWELGGTGIDLLVPPAITDTVGPRIHVRPAARLGMLYVEEPSLRAVSRLVKGLMDRLVAGALLLVLAPVIAVIACLIKATSRGPVLFLQQRPGLHGRPFRIWKFRTMRTDLVPCPVALELDAVHNKGANDPRITRLGKVLRQTSLDELPQLVNVVLGHMSLVGPRPVLTEQFIDPKAEESRRHLVKPGMTGLWQVSGRSNIAWQERVNLDLYYVENWSLMLDIVIMARTLPVVTRRTGAF